MHKIRGITLINDSKLSFESRDLLKKIDKLFESDMICKVLILAKDFDILLKAVMPSYKMIAKISYLIRENRQ